MLENKPLTERQVSLKPKEASVLVVMETPPPLQTSHLHLRRNHEEFSVSQHLRDKQVNQESLDTQAVSGRDASALFCPEF